MKSDVANDVPSPNAEKAVLTKINCCFQRGNARLPPKGKRTSGSVCLFSWGGGGGGGGGWVRKDSYSPLI